MIAIGAYSQNGTTYYYAVVRGKASRRSYSGTYGLLRALAEAHWDEELIRLKEYAWQLDHFRERLMKERFEDMLMELAGLGADLGIVMILDADTKASFTYTDAHGMLPLMDDGRTLKGDETFDDEDDVFASLKRSLEPGLPR